MQLPPHAVNAALWREMRKQRSSSPQAATRLHQCWRIEVYCAAPPFEVCKACWEGAPKWVHWPNDAERPEPARSLFRNGVCGPSPEPSLRSSPSPPEPSESGREARTGAAGQSSSSLLRPLQSDASRVDRDLSHGVLGEFRRVPPSSTPRHQMAVTRSVTHKAALPDYRRQCACPRPHRLCPPVPGSCTQVSQ